VLAVVVDAVCTMGVAGVEAAAEEVLLGAAGLDAAGLETLDVVVCGAEAFG
jgi:hypothetical protein